MMPPLISFELAKSHLHIINSDHDSDIDSKMRLASGIVANHCKLTAIPDDWIVDSSEIDLDSSDLIIFLDMSSPPDHYIRVPGNIQAAVLLVLTNIFDDPTGTGEILSDTIKDLLAPFRDPTLA